MTINEVHDDLQLDDFGFGASSDPSDDARLIAQQQTAALLEKARQQQAQMGSVSDGLRDLIRQSGANIGA